MVRGHQQEGVCGLLLDLQESMGKTSPRATLARIKNTGADTDRASRSVGKCSFFNSDADRQVQDHLIKVLSEASGWAAPV